MLRPIAALFFSMAIARAAAPVIFFTDLDSGPKTGGESNNGVYVTLYGSNFGASRGTSTVTIGGGAPAQYKVWSAAVWGGASGTSYDKVTVQLGASAASGSIVLTTSSGASNAVPFTVRAGNIYFASNSGNDAAAGTFAAPWATLTHARDTMSPGDTVYARAGTYLNVDDGSGWSTCLKMSSANSGTASGYNAFVAYPGEVVNLGDTNNCATTIRGSDNTGENYWTFAGFATVIGHDITFNPSNTHNWRIIGNSNVTCPNGNSPSGCVDIGGTQDGTEYNYWVYGNNINHAATNQSPGSVTALYHGVYLSQQIHGMQFAWNTVSNVYGGRCIQQNVNNNSTSDHSSAYDLHIHDNVIHDCQLDGIIMTTVNPSLGTVELYNNIIYNAGIGPNNQDGSGTWSCIDVQGWQNGYSSGESGTIQVYNNSMYGCGTFANPPYAESSGGFLWEPGNTQKTVNFYNNIIQLTTGPANLPYLALYAFNGAWCTTAAPCNDLTGSNNDFYGLGGVPTNAVLTGSLNLNPQFTGNYLVGNTLLALLGPILTIGTQTSGPAAPTGISANAK